MTDEPQSDPRSRFGLNEPQSDPRSRFELNQVDLIVRVAQLAKDDLAVEVGSGTGGLTARLADAAGTVLSVEIDPAFADLPIERMVVTVQWEIAERLTARPGTKDYGALAVLVQSLAYVELIRRLPPSVFFPRPQVASAIVRLFPNAG